MQLSEILNFSKHDIQSADFQERCRETLDDEGVLVLPDFLSGSALKNLQDEASEGREKAYFCAQNHSVYLTPHDNSYAANHAKNKQVISSKGCICDDDVAYDSVLRHVYDATEFREFVMAVTGETSLHPYADPLSSINIHYAEYGQELGWHFDNSEFAITLLIDKPDAGSRFEYVKNLRDAEAGEMNYQGVAELLEGKIQPTVLSMEPGTLVLFRGRNSIHRVSPNESDKTRMLAVLAYNSQEGVELSESARMTFYGRLN